MVREMNDVIEFVEVSMKSFEERAKYYIDKKRSFLEFEVGDKAILKVTLQRSGLKLEKSKKLSPNFCGLLEISKR
jgi:hypothetical protein